MPLYKCEIVSSDNKVYTKQYDFINEDMLKAHIRKNNEYLLSFQVVKEKKVNTFFAVSSKVKPLEVVLFLRQFSVMLSAGATIVEALDSLKKQKHSKAFERVLQEIYDDVMRGILLSDAIKRHPQVFPRYFQNMISIGELSGTLETVLVNLATYYENDRKVKSKAKTAMIYPIFLCVLIFVVILFLSLFIIPQFEKIILDLNGEIPKITQITLDFSKFMKKYFFFIIAFFIIFSFGIYLFFKSKKGKKIKGALALNLPFIGKINRELITTRFAKAFIILLSSGMTITTCMDNLKQMLVNEKLMAKFDLVIYDIKKGEPIAASLNKLHFFPEILIDMIDVGEKSGNLETTLSSTSSYFDERVENAIARATTAMEPLMILILGVIVVFVILAVFLPIIGVMQSI